MDNKLLRTRAQNLRPVVQIGKSGLTENVIGEIAKQLKKRKLIKIKLLKSVLEDIDKRELAELISETTGSEIVSLTGFVVVLYKR